MSASLSYNNLPDSSNILNYQPNPTKPNPKLINELTNKQITKLYRKKIKLF